MDDHKTSVPFTFDSSIIENALKNIQSRQLDTRTQIDKGLFSEVNRILANGIDIAYDDKSGNGSGFKKELLTNTEVFAAFKAHRMGRDMASKLLDESGEHQTIPAVQTGHRGACKPPCQCVAPDRI